MDDLISRKAAIEAIYEAFPECHNIGMAASALEDVPPAQPEIVRCKDCKHSAPNGKYGCTVYHYRLYDTHEMTPNDFCSRGERKENG